MFQTINNQSVGLLFKNGNYERMLLPGNHFIWPGSNLEIFTRGTYIPAHIPLAAIVKDDRVKAELRVIEVKDNEIGLHFKNGNFQHVLVPGKYAHWKDEEERVFMLVDINNPVIDNSIQRNIFGRTEITGYLRQFNVASYEKGLLFIDNKFIKLVEPGQYTFWKNSQPLDILKVDMRQLQLEVSGQEILTADKAAVRINF